MLDFFKRKTKTPSLDNTSNSEGKPEGEQDKPEIKLFSRLKNGLSRSRQSFTEGLSQIFLGKKEIDEELLEELEGLLISADLGVEVTSKITQELTLKVKRQQLNDRAELIRELKTYLKNVLLPYEVPLEIPGTVKPFVILMVGVNGAGKTTTIGKIAGKLKAEGKQLLLAAGDTFRAAAIEQLQSFGDKSQIPVIAQHSGADSASVIYDAFQAAQSRLVDVLIADTAGRLHTQDNLMEELKKVVRVIKKQDPLAPHEILLVLDGGIGQNAVAQAKKFYEAVGVTGLVLTKLDGTAKGGIIFNIANSLKLPIRFIGVGEAIEDLRPFEAEAFVEALFSELKVSDSQE
jgi:fused signal recognition particle receptor